MSLRFNCRGYSIDLSKKTCIMGILNITPDSFSDGGLFFGIDAALSRAMKIADEGADIIDIGGESTRPGSCAVSAEEELSRIIPAIKKIRHKIKIPISVDTYKPEVAEVALEEGASIVNDITGLKDERMAKIVKKFNAGVIIMHIRGTPATIQKSPRYKDLLGEIIKRLKRGIGCARSAGIKRSSIVIDPGIGFGKTVSHNLAILRNLDKLRKLGFPVLIGASRKSFIGKILCADAGERLYGSLGVAALAIAGGASILRAHDVKETVQVARACDAILK